MLARRARAKVATRDQNACAPILRLVEHEVRVGRAVGQHAPIEEQPLLETGAGDALEELLGNDLVGVDVDSVQRGDQAGVLSKRVHADQAFQSRMSTKWPAIAAAAAIGGLTRWVRPPLPWRPSKLRLEVLAQRSPGCRMSGFMPRHMLQPASRHSKPALENTSSRPSRSAAA